MRFIGPMVLLVALCISGHAQPKNTDPWSGWEFLVGRWTAIGGGAPGQGTGWTSFEFDLNRRVLIRRNHNDYPATKDRPAFAHDDLMIAYPQPGSTQVQADYWDNEGHVIHYQAGLSREGNTIQFISTPAAGQPTFRLTYMKASADELKICFEIAPPEKPGEFKVYVEGAARREK